MSIWQYFKLDKGRIFSLDVLRATAITLVVLYHWPKENSQILFRAFSHYGYLGVDLFFVLSGYLIVGQGLNLVKKDKFSIHRFYVRRFMRTLPNYYFILLMGILVYGLEKFDWRYFLFLQNFGGLYQYTFTWSLCVEEHFYLFVPLIILFLAKKNKLHSIPWITLVIVLAGLILRSMIWVKYRPDLAYKQNVDTGYDIYFNNIFYPSYSRLDGLAIGALLAYFKSYQELLWDKLTVMSKRFLPLFLIIFILLLLSIYYKTVFVNSVFGFLFMALSFGYFLLYAFSPQNYLDKIKIPGISLVSILSYSLYLTHGLAFHFSQHVIDYYQFSNLSFFSHLIRLVFVFCLSSLLYWGLEKPILKLRDSILVKSRPQ